MNFDVPDIPVGDFIETVFDAVTENLEGLFDFISVVLGAVVNSLTDALLAPNPVILAVVFAALALVVAGWRFGLASLVGMILVTGMGQWESAMETLGLVLTATVISVAMGVPIGILAASSKRVSSVVKPVMDFMQTMPALVWLVPVVTLFGIGMVPGVVATIIFAIPPGVRLTELGIRNVDPEIVEAAHAFGSASRQTLFGVQLPLAMPTIMAGVNQVIMLALSMAVIAGLVGAAGLGGEVVASIATMNLGRGFEAGISVVILAIYLDRITAGAGGGSLARAWRRVRRPQTPAEVGDLMVETVVSTQDDPIPALQQANAQ